MAPEDVRREASADAQAANQHMLLARQADNLGDQAQRMVDGGAATGITGTVGEFLKRITGNENGYTQTRNAITQFRNSGIVNALSDAGGRLSGPALELFQGGFPDATASGELLRDTFRTAAQAHRLDAAISVVSAEWRKKNLDLGPATKAFTVGGRQVQEGDDFNAFIEKNILPKFPALAPGAGNRPAPQAAAQAPAPDTAQSPATASPPVQPRPQKTVPDSAIAQQLGGRSSRSG